MLQKTKNNMNHYTFGLQSINPLFIYKHDIFMI